MGTLTADCPDLRPVQCPHKLPSSCRLTSTPLCCACADTRPHSLTYRIYIDGVGFVHRGTRWQSYCWFCKSFWDARVVASGLSPSDTKIPDDPDQSEFVDRWFEFHQGYRKVLREDGTEVRITVAGEPLKDVDPGHLPRTLEELRAGRREILGSDRQRRDRPVEASAEPHVSLEEALDQLLEELDSEDEDSQHGDSAPIPPDPQGAQNTTIQPLNADSESRAHLDDAYAEAQRAVDAAQRVRDRAHARLTNADEELAVVRERLRRIRGQQITMGNFARVFGTREDVQSDDYVSPITTMFHRQAQWGRENAERLRVLREQQEALNNFENINRASEPPETVTRTNAPAAPLSTIATLNRLREYIDAQRSGNRTATQGLADWENLDLQPEPSLLPRVNPVDSFLMVDAPVNPAPPTPGEIARTRVLARLVRENSTEPPGLQAALARIARTLSDEDTFYVENTFARIAGEGNTLPNASEGVPQSIGSADSLSGVNADEQEVDTNIPQATETTAENPAAREPWDTIVEDLAAESGVTRGPGILLWLSQQIEADVTTEARPAVWSNGAPPWRIRNRTTFQASSDFPEPSFPGLDGDRRPVAKQDEDMVVKLECKICLQQIANTACLPCGHLSMCEWCAEQWIPCRAEDKTRPVEKGIKCPVCRARVKSRVKIFVG